MKVGNEFFSMLEEVMPANIREYTAIDFLEIALTVLSLSVLFVLFLFKTKMGQRVFKKIEWMF